MQVYLDLATSTLTFPHLSHPHFPSTLDTFRYLQPVYHHRKFSRVHNNLWLCFFFHPSSHPIALVAATASFAPHLPHSAPSFHLVLQIHLISLTFILQLLFMFGLCNFSLMFAISCLFLATLLCYRAFAFAVIVSCTTFIKHCILFFFLQLTFASFYLCNLSPLFVVSCLVFL